MNQAGRRKILLAASALLVTPLAGAQQPAKVARIGFLANSDAPTLAGYMDAFLLYKTALELT